MLLNISFQNGVALTTFRYRDFHTKIYERNSNENDR